MQRQQRHTAPAAGRIAAAATNAPASTSALEAPLPDRAGVVLFALLVCLVAATGMFTILIQTTFTHGRQFRVSERRLQAAWLVESGVERAALQLAADPKYQGEVWQVPAGELAGHDAATVRIEVKSVANAPRRRELRVAVDYPAGALTGARLQKQVMLDRVQP